MVVLDLCLLSFGSNVNLIACLSTLSAWPSVRLCVSLAASEARAVNDLTAAGLFGPTSGRQRGGEREREWTNNGPLPRLLGGRAEGPQGEARSHAVPSRSGYLRRRKPALGPALPGATTIVGG